MKLRPKSKPDDREQLDSRSFAQLANSLFTGSAAGFQVSGDSGTGKSVTLLDIALAALRSRTPLMLLDPHGNTAQELKRHVLDQPKRIRDKVIFIKPSDLRVAVSINPLAVSHDGLSDHEYWARLSTKVSHTASILLAAYGEGEFGYRTLLRKWAVRFLRTLAAAELRGCPKTKGSKTRDSRVLPTLC